MAITLRKQADADVVSPSPARVSYYVDGTTPKTKNSAASVVNTALDESPIVLADQVSAPSTLVNNSKVYAKDVSGNSELFFLDGSGAEVQVTSNGNLAGVSGTPTTWFSGETSEQLNFEYVGLSGPQNTTTTNAYSLTAAQFCGLFIRVNMVEYDSFTFNWQYWQMFGFGWQGGVPSLPASISTLTWFNTDESPGFSTSPFNSITLLADGRLQFTISFPFSIAGSIQIGMSDFAMPFTV